LDAGNPDHQYLHAAEEMDVRVYHPSVTNYQVALAHNESTI
jgi:hypothetical protein